MKLIRLFVCCVFFCTTIATNAQMISGTDTLYGNEWIDYSQSYFKVKVAEDGMYRIDYNTLNNAGVFGGTTIPQGQQLQLFKNGKSVPLYVSNSGGLTSSDYITFYGTKNRGEIDKYLYENPNYQVNPYYSLFTDTAYYYLSWNPNTSNPDIITNTPNDLSNLPPKEKYCWKEKVFSWGTYHSTGVSRGGSGNVSAKYDLGEGYTRGTNSTNQAVGFGMTERYLINNPPDALFEMQTLHQDGNHHIAVSVNNVPYLVDTFYGWAVKNHQVSVPMSTTNFNSPMRVTATASTDDKFRIAYAKVTYPRNLKFDNLNIFEFKLDSSWQKQYLEIENFDHGGSHPILYDLTNQIRIQTQISNNKILVTVPPSSSRSDLILVSDAALLTTTVEAVQFTNFSPTQGGDYIMLTHSKLFDNGSGVNYIQDYANYRSSALGGNFTPVVVDIDQIYEQFGYGVDRHEQSIRNFAQWAIKHWNSDYLLIIGKGVYYGKYRNNDPFFKDFDLVPSFGFPTSDNLLVAKPHTDEPMIAVGRVAAYTPDMVRIYLDKVKELEAAYQTTPQTIQDKAWMKNFLHLGGGDTYIQDFIKNRLRAMEDTISQSKLGANVLGYYKNSTNVIQNANSSDVTDRINEGLAWITFFGHSAPNTLDFDIGDPNQYNNQGKYPMIYAMGCNTNRLLESSNTLSEDYVFVEDRGAIGFIGSTATTSLPDLNEYGKILYKIMGDDFYGESIGNILKETVHAYPTGGFWEALVKHNIFLHGDPAIKIYPNAGADYIVNKSKTTIVPNFVNVSEDSFQVNLVINNIGSANQDSINVLIEQKYPNNNIVTLKTIRVKTPSFEETYTIWLPLDNKEVLGTNELLITIDVDDEVLEVPSMAENNNFETIPFAVISNNAIPITPYEYGIVSDPTVKLKASTANILSDEITYYLEMDTSKMFDSSVKISTTINSKGGLISWQPSFVFQDSMVYYWRISIDSVHTNGNGFDWKNSSFIYIPQSLQGWNQSHYQQQQQVTENTIEIDAIQKFQSLTKEIKVLNSNLQSGFNASEISIYFDGYKEATGYPCPQGWQEVLHIAVIDEKTLDWKKAATPSVNVNCWVPEIYYMIRPVDNVTDRMAVVHFLEDSIETGDIVLFFTMKRATQTLHTNLWAADSLVAGAQQMNIFNRLEKEGAKQIRNMVNNETSYIFIYKKGFPNWQGTNEVHASTTSEIIQATSIVNGKRLNGQVTSLPIGPAKSWGDVNWRVSGFDSSMDSMYLDVIGVTVDGSDSLLMSNILTTNLSLDFVDPIMYPYIKLRYYTSDILNATPVQLDYWRAFYEPYPDAALTPQTHFVFHADTIQQGDMFRFEIGVENVSQTDMDSLLVKYVVTNATNQETIIQNREAQLLSDSSIIVDLSIDTRNRVGNHSINIEVNPDNDQRELYQFNNVGVANFYVESDNIAPVLDVTFDGIHIMSGDIVSSAPTILIALEDENPFIALEDTSTFELYVVSPSGTSTRYYVDNQTVIFRPADGTNLNNKNRAEIEFLPEFTTDGVYQLMVKAKDGTANLSGANEYKIDFEVITKAMVSNVLNYPNPFSTATQFVFTLTGAEIPEAMNIQIMTVSGKLVRTITMDELGDIHIGLNRTEFRWDGTDDFGNPLANGVYLYRVNIKSATDETYELFNTGTNDYFKGGFGKMVILK